MGFFREKSYLLILAVVILFAAGIYLTPNFISLEEKISQAISFSDFNIAKTIILNENTNTRTEIYEFSATNPAAVFLIVPKQIAEDISQLSLEGDFSSEVIEIDPILLLTQKDLSPGKKLIKIKAPLGEKSKTSIIFAVPLSKYNLLDATDADSFKELIKEAALQDENNFDIGQSKEVMQNFLDNLLEADLLGEESESKLFFASAKSTKRTSSEILSILSGAISKSVIISEKQNGSSLITSTVQGIQMDVSFAKANIATFDEVTDIELFVSKEFPEDRAVISFEDKEVTTIPFVELSGIDEDRLEYEWTEQTSPYSLAIRTIIPSEIINNTSDGAITESTIIIKAFAKQKTIRVTIKYGKCEQLVGEAARKVKLSSEEKNTLLFNCYIERLTELEEEISYDTNRIYHLREALIEDANKKAEKVVTLTLEVGGKKVLQQYNEMSDMLIVNGNVYSVKELGMLKLMEILSNIELIEYTDENNAVEQITSKDLRLFPGSISVSENEADYSADENLVKEYYARIARVNKLFIEAEKTFYAAKEKIIGQFKTEMGADDELSKLIGGTIKDESIDLANTLFEEKGKLQEQKTSMLELIGSTKLMQLTLAQKNLLTLENGSVIGQQGYKGWNFSEPSKVNAQSDTLLGMISREETALVLHYREGKTFFSTNEEIIGYDYFAKNSRRARFYSEYYSKLSSLALTETEELNGWNDELTLAIKEYELYKHLATHPDLNSTDKNEIINLGLKRKNHRLLYYLIRYFDEEISNDIELLVALIGIPEYTLNEALEKEGTPIAGWGASGINASLNVPDWYEYIYKPVLVGDWMRRALDGTNSKQVGLTDGEVAELKAYLKTAETKKTNLTNLRNFILEEYEKHLKDEDTNLTQLNFFSALEKNYVNRVKGEITYSTLIKQRIFIKYKTLEKELASFGDKNSAPSQEIKEFMKKEQEQTYGVALSYGSEKILPIARIKLEEIIKIGELYENDPNLDTTTLAKAKESYNQIKPELTKFEKAENWFKKNFSAELTASQKAEQYATIDYRTSTGIWLNRMEFMTDLRYYVAFHGLGAGAKASVKSIGGFLTSEQTVGKTVSGAVTKFVSWGTKKYYLTEILARNAVLRTVGLGVKRVSVESWQKIGGPKAILFLRKTGYWLSEKMQVVNPREYERLWLTKMYLQNPKTAVVLGSNFSSYAGVIEARLLGYRRISGHILKEGIVQDNILTKNGTLRQLFGVSAVTQAGLKKETYKEIQRVGEKGVASIAYVADTKGRQFLLFTQYTPDEFAFRSTAIAPVKQKQWLFVIENAKDLKGLDNEIGAAMERVLTEKVAASTTATSATSALATINTATGMVAIETEKTLAGAAEVLAKEGLIFTRQGAIVLGTSDTTRLATTYYPLVEGETATTSETIKSLAVLQTPSSPVLIHPRTITYTTSTRTLIVPDEMLPATTSALKINNVRITLNVPVEVVPEEQLANAVGFTITCHSPCNIIEAKNVSLSIPELQSMGDKQIKIGKSGLAQGGNTVAIEWQTNNPNAKIIVRTPLPNEIYSKTAEPGISNPTPANLVREGEAKIVFQSDEVLELVGPTSITWVVNGEIKRLPGITNTSSSVSFFVNSRKDFAGRFTIGPKEQLCSIDAEGKNLPKLSVVPEKGTNGEIKTLSVRSVSRDIRTNARVVRTNGEETLVPNIPTGVDGESLASAGEKVMLTEGDIIVIGDTMVAPYLNEAGLIFVNIGNPNSGARYFDRSRIYIGNSMDEVDVAVSDPNAPMIKLARLNSGQLQATSVSRSLRSEAIIDHASGARETIKNKSGNVFSPGVNLSSGDVIELGGERFKIDMTNGMLLGVVRLTKTISAQIVPDQTIIDLRAIARRNPLDLEGDHEKIFGYHITLYAPSNNSRELAREASLKTREALLDEALDKAKIGVGTPIKVALEDGTALATPGNSLTFAGTKTEDKEVWIGVNEIVPNDEPVFYYMKLSALGTMQKASTAKSLIFHCSDCKWINGNHVQVIEGDAFEFDVRGNSLGDEIQGLPMIRAYRDLPDAMFNRNGLTPEEVRTAEEAIKAGKSVATINTETTGKQRITIYVSNTAVSKKNPFLEIEDLSRNSVADNSAVIAYAREIKIPVINMSDLTLTEKVGEGVSAVVFRGTLKGETVAIKALKSYSQGDIKAQTNNLAGSKALSDLEVGPKMIGVVETGVNPAMVTEYAPGKQVSEMTVGEALKLNPSDTAENHFALVKKLVDAGYIDLDGYQAVFITEGEKKGSLLLVDGERVFRLNDLEPHLVSARDSLTRIKETITTTYLDTSAFAVLASEDTINRAVLTNPTIYYRGGIINIPGEKKLITKISGKKILLISEPGGDVTAAYSGKLGGSPNEFVADNSINQDADWSAEILGN